MINRRLDLATYLAPTQHSTVSFGQVENLSYIPRNQMRTISDGTRRSTCLISLFFIVLSSAPVAMSQEAKPQGKVSTEDIEWLWNNAERTAGQSATFDRQFELAQIPASALLTVGAESAWLELFLDEEPLGKIGPYDAIRHIDLSDRIGAGSHNLTVRATSVAGPAAFFVQLRLEQLGGVHFLGSNQQWRCQRPDQRGNDSQVVSLGAVGVRFLIQPREVGISRLDNYEQWKLAQDGTPGTEDSGVPTSLSVVPGFEVQHVRSSKGDEDSWVSMAFDPQGRVVVAKEQKGLLRFTLAADGESVEKTELIDDQLRECRGIVFAGQQMFVNANNDKGLYRVEVNADSSLGKRTLLYASDGGVGHGRNDLTIGADGKLYTIQGDSVHLPSDAKDWTSPFRDARRGERTSEGHLLRIDPKTGKVEILTAGLRNPFGVAINRHGDPFTYDADAEYDMGSPWYRPTRVSHLVAGGDYGWRGVTRSWPSYYPDHPDNAPPNLDIGKGSPTAVMFGTNSNFPDRYQQALFVMDWAYGRILAVHTVRRGASYLMTAETFLKGKPLNVTSLDFAPDGSMYFVTGGRKTQSALFRVRHTGTPGPSKAKIKPTAQQQARQKFAAASHATRRRLESMLEGGDLSNDNWNLVASSLQSADPWIRYAARCVTERQPVKEWRRLHAVPASSIPSDVFLILARSKDEQLARRCIEQMNRVDWAQLDTSQRSAVAYSYWLCLRQIQASKKTADGQALQGTAIERLHKVYPSGDYRTDQWLSEILIGTEAPTLASTLDQLMATTNQNRRMHFLYVLRNKRSEWTAAQREQYFRALAETSEYLGGQGMPDFISRIREEVLETLSDDEKKLYEKIAVVNANEQTVSVKNREFVKKWTLDELRDSKKIREGTGSSERGRQLFAETSCIRCHRHRTTGSSIGPDLTFVGSRFGRVDLLRSIIHPSEVIAEKYRSIQIVTTDGRTLIGRPAPGGDYRSPVLRLAIDPLDLRKVAEINKEDIDIQNDSPTSWMPTGLLDTLNESEIIDLLTFLEGGSE